MKIARRLVLLGIARELVIEDDAHAYKRIAWKLPRSGDIESGLFSNGKGTALFILPIRAPVPQDGSAPRDLAVLFRKWSQLEPSTLFRFKVPDRSATLFKNGYARSILYRSGKWTGRDEDYLHTFEMEPGPVMYADRQGAGRGAASAYGILRTDGKPLVTARGIIG